MITITTVPHDQQRYETVGDWLTVGKDLVIRVSDMGRPDYEFCVGLHELIEAYLCKRAGITDEAVTAFDVQFEKDRAAGLHRSDEEPGDHPDAPYRLQHQFATKIEKLLAAQLGLDWSEYEGAIASL